MTDLTVTDGHVGTRTSRTRNSVDGSESGALRTQLEQQRAFRARQLAELAPTTQPDSAAATEEPVRQVALALTAAATVVLGDIDAALERIERGRYGRCGRCGVDIQLERLQALPKVRLCMPCPAKHEMSRTWQQDHPGHRQQAVLDPVEKWGHGSFPASDPPANW